MFFFFNDTATTEIYTLSLHDALPILGVPPDEQRPVGALRRAVLADGLGGGDDVRLVERPVERRPAVPRGAEGDLLDRKSTRLNSSHANISYAVFCLKKKKICYFNSVQ